MSKHDYGDGCIHYLICAHIHVCWSLHGQLGGGLHAAVHTISGQEAQNKQLVGYYGGLLWVGVEYRQCYVVHLC